MHILRVKAIPFEIILFTNELRHLDARRLMQPRKITYISYFLYTIRAIPGSQAPTALIKGKPSPLLPPLGKKKKEKRAAFYRAKQQVTFPDLPVPCIPRKCIPSGQRIYSNPSTNDNSPSIGGRQIAS